MNLPSTLVAWHTCLLDSSAEASQKRDQIADKAGLIKIISGFSGCFFGASGVIGLGLINHYPISGMYFTASLGMLAFGCWESYSIGKNVEMLMSGPNLTRRGSTMTAENTVRSIFKDTLLIGPLCATTLIRQLEKAQKV